MAYGGILLVMVLVGGILLRYRADANAKQVGQFLEENRHKLGDASSASDNDASKSQRPASQPSEINQKADSIKSNPTPPLPPGLADASDGCLQVLLLLVALIGGFCFLVRGLVMVLQPILVPPDAPGGVNGLRRNIKPLLEALPNDDLYIGTYKIPRGDLAVILHSISPNNCFLTPPVKKIIPSWWFLIGSLVSCLALGCAGLAGGWGMLLIPASLLLMFPISAMAVLLCRPRRPVSPEVIQHDVTRIDAGNPQSLYEKLRHDGLDEIRSPIQKVNRADRMSCFNKERERDDAGHSRLSTTFDWHIALESEPLLVPGNAQLPLAAWTLEGAALAYCFVGATCILTLPWGAFWGLKLAGVVPLFLAVRLMDAAYILRNTFRWKSDLFAVIATGTLQRQRAGGEQANFQVERIHSQMHLSVLGTRVISENTSPGVWKGQNKAKQEDELGNLRSALGAARYLIETHVDDAFRNKVQSVLQMLQQYHDTEGTVMGVDERSAGAHSLQTNIDDREQKKLMTQMKQQLQAMLFGKALEKMTPEQLQQMMLNGGALDSRQLPQPSEPMISQSPQPSQQSITPAPASRQASVDSAHALSPEIENLVRDAYRVCLSPGQTEASRTANLGLLKSLLHQFRVPPEKQQSLQKQALAELGKKPTAVLV